MVYDKPTQVQSNATMIRWGQDKKKKGVCASGIVGTVVGE
jgi:hypothetical protein